MAENDPPLIEGTVNELAERRGGTGRSAEGRRPRLAARSGALRDGGGVHQEEAGLLRSGVEGHVDPAHLAAVLPGERQRPRRLAPEHLTAGVALDLVATAERQVARDRATHPPRHALGAGERVPHLLDRRGVGALGGEPTQLLPVALDG